MNPEKNLLKDQLGTLPKYSLNEEQKQNIVMKLREQQTTSRKKLHLKPLLAIITALVLFSLLAFHEFNLFNLSTANHPTIELEAPEGKLFTLPDDGREAIGIEGEVALLNTFDQFVAEDRRRGAKIMIFYWGDSIQLTGKNYTVEAINRKGDQFTLSEGELYTPLNNEDAHTLTNFEPFPTDGKWQLTFKVDGKTHSAFTLDVLPPFPKTEHYTLVHSPKEIDIGKKSLLTIESTWENKKEIDVTLLNEDGKEVAKTTFIQDAEFIDSFTNKPLYHFSGHLIFPEQGTWTLIIDGEQTKEFEN